jgi:hypothetical protein
MRVLGRSAAWPPPGVMSGRSATSRTREAAKLRGKRAVRKPVLTDDQADAAWRIHAACDSVREIMAVFSAG